MAMKRTAFNIKRNMLFVIVGLLAYLSQCIAGDPCPTEDELKFCTCNRKEMLNPFDSSSSPSGLSIDRKIELARSRMNATDDEVVDVEARSKNTSSKPNYLYTVVVCNVSRNIIALEEVVVLGLNRKLVDKLTVYHVPPINEQLLARLPDRWLRNTRVKQIQILNSTLAGDFIWRGHPFEGQEQSLIVIAVNNCFLYGALTYDVLRTVNTKGLDQLPKIEVVDFSRNHLTAITTSAFSRPPFNLSTINLSYNSINLIEVGALKMIQRLKSINLSHNQLETVNRGIFAAPARSLESIDLSWNALQILNPDFFTNMPALKKVILMKNFLYSLPDKPWNLIWKQLEFVNLEGNFIDCDCSLLWLITPDKPANSSVSTTPSTEVFINSDMNLMGSCMYQLIEMPAGVVYELKTLTKDKIMCDK